MESGRSVRTRRESLRRLEDLQKSQPCLTASYASDKTTCHDLNFRSAGRVSDENHSVTQFDLKKITTIMFHIGKKLLNYLWMSNLKLDIQVSMVAT